MTNPPPKSGGMPKWLIILLVIFLFIALGCCGILGTCYYIGRKAVVAATQKAGEIADAGQKARDEWAAATQAAADATQKAAAATQGMGGNGLPTKGPDGATPGDAGGNPPTVNNGGSAGGNPPGGTGGGATPSRVTYGANNLPTDLPVMSGMTPTGLSGVDRVSNSGAAQFTTKSSPADVAAYYQKQLTGQGWTVTDNVSINGMTSMGFAKGGRKTVVMAMPADSNTMVTVSFESH